MSILPGASSERRVWQHGEGSYSTETIIENHARHVFTCIQPGSLHHLIIVRGDDLRVLW
jgi:hypothetical protein